VRVIEVYRREDGEWKVAHRHADTGDHMTVARPPGAARSATWRKHAMSAPTPCVNIPIMLSRLVVVLTLALALAPATIARSRGTPIR
jgi:hypothetical protein